MKPETKKKLLKAAKLAAYIVLGGFATLGVAASMICLTQCTAQKPEIETSVSVSSPRALKPKRSIVNNYVVAAGDYRLMCNNFTGTTTSTKYYASCSGLVISYGSYSFTPNSLYSPSGGHYLVFRVAPSYNQSGDTYPQLNAYWDSGTTYPNGWYRLYESSSSQLLNVSSGGDTGVIFSFANDWTVPSISNRSSWVNFLNTCLVAIPRTNVDVNISVDNGAFKYGLEDSETHIQHVRNYTSESLNNSLYVFPLAGYKVPSSVSPTGNTAGVSYHWSVANDYGLLTFSVETDSVGVFTLSINMPVNDVEGVDDTTTIQLGQHYDFRKWIGDIDPNTGLMHIRCVDLGQTGGLGAVALTFGGAEFKLVGNDRVYNFVQIVVTDVGDGSSHYFLYGNGDDARAYSASDLYGSKWNEYSYISSVSFGYQYDYSGAKYVGQFNGEYKDRVYNGNVATSAPDASGTLVSCFDVRNVRVPYLYRSFTIEEDSGLRLDIPNMPQTTLVEAFKSDLSTTEITTLNNGDVFGMFSNAFTAVGAVLSVEILPHISVGVLLFLPLVVIIIVAIVKVLNK